MIAVRIEPICFIGTFHLKPLLTTSITTEIGFTSLPSICAYRPENVSISDLYAFYREPKNRRPSIQINHIVHHISSYSFAAIQNHVPQADYVVAFRPFYIKLPQDPTDYPLGYQDFYMRITFYVQRIGRSFPVSFITITSRCNLSQPPTVRVVILEAIFDKAILPHLLTCVHSFID